MNLSIIIPYHEEGIEFITTTIKSIRETIDVENYEIIVVDDFSKEPLPEIDDVKIFRHTENKGVGAAFDTGVIFAESENLFLITVEDNGVGFNPNSIDEFSGLGFKNIKNRKCRL